MLHSLCIKKVDTYSCEFLRVFHVQVVLSFGKRHVLHWNVVSFQAINNFISHVLSEKKVFLAVDNKRTCCYVFELSAANVAITLVLLKLI